MKKSQHILSVWLIFMGLNDKLTFHFRLAIQCNFMCNVYRPGMKTTELNNFLKVRVMIDISIIRTFVIFTSQKPKKEEEN